MKGAAQSTGCSEDHVGLISTGYSKIPPGPLSAV